nr:putative zinc finger, CCHC-type, retrotransposon Gag domain protein [Tanacetum cinerariifolium]
HGLRRQRPTKEISAEKSWVTIEKLARYEDEGWNDPITVGEGSLNYENPDIEQLLGVMECKVDTLMKEAILLMGRSKSVFRMTSNIMYQLPSEPSRQEEFEDLVMNFILDQEERIKQLENYMQDITDEFMEFSSDVTLRLKERIKENEKPQPLLNNPSLDVSLGDVIGPVPPIKPYSLDSSRMKGLESTEVSPPGEELSLFDRPNEVERVVFSDNRSVRNSYSLYFENYVIASMTHEEVEELIARRVVKEIEAREVARNLNTLNENEEEQEGENGGNENGGNGGNGNEGNGNHGINYGGFMPMARECTFQEFLKCKPHAFSRTEGVVGLTRWFKKMETVFNISNCPPKYQVKYATCTLQNSALTWFQDLNLLCTRMVPDEEDRVERFIRGLPDNI